ncbi:hypothetical protein FOZ60_008442 [Perkinsus olseni]|uniref:Uncharacterized protein n=1 Tax=Perkinsus olseni TaxID=32597 RepID=A0A7J6PDT9_PEROL|nr:hypothetical protein FOZ60_008442 [Perkinsus olseni]
MNTTFGILSIVCLLGVALDFENEDPAGFYSVVSPLLDASAGFENPVDQGEGGPYEKPVGNCYVSPEGYILGCKCTTLDALVVANKTGTVISAVCVSDCSATGTCPGPPKGSPECLPIVKVCAINCKQDSDCLEGGYCQDLSKYSPGIQRRACMFRQG